MSGGATAGAETGMGLRLALDLGPLAVYFAAYAASRHDIFVATGLFIAATLVAMLLSWWRFGRISAIQLFSAGMVLVLGGLTIWLHKDWIIKVKPTIYYLTVAGALFYGLLTGRPTLQMVLGQAYPGLRAEGWRILTRNWAIFFLAMAVANELVWRTSAAYWPAARATGFWLGYKLWGAMPATVLFALANVPVLTRHGLGEREPPLLPEE